MIIAKELESWIEGEMKKVPGVLPEVPPDVVVLDNYDGGYTVSFSATRRASEGEPAAYRQKPFGWIQHVGAVAIISKTEAQLPPVDLERLVAERCRESMREFFKWVKTIGSAA